MFLQISFLSELGAANFSFKGFFTRMHTCVVEEVPGFNKLFSSTSESAMNDPLPPSRAFAGDVTYIILVAFQDIQIFVLM
jgi:hypothetical protein